MTAIAVLVQPIDRATGQRVTLRMTSKDAAWATGMGGDVWVPSITGRPRIESQFFEGNFDSPITPSSATLQFSLLNITDYLKQVGIAATKDLSWRGAPVTIYSGRQNDSWPWRVALKGQINDYAEQNGQAQAPIEVDQEPFAADLLTRQYAGTTGAEGPIDLRDDLKPLVIGYCKNVEPVLIDAIDNVWQFSGYGPIQSVDALYERASLFVPVTTPIPDYDDYDALVDAGIAPGLWATCLAEGMIRLGAPAAGLITGDIRGHVFAQGYADRPGLLSRRLLDMAGVSSDRVNASAFDAIDTAIATWPNLGRVGASITGQTTLLDVVHRLVSNANGIATIGNDGRIGAHRVAFSSSPLMTLDASGRQLPVVINSQEDAAQLPFRRYVVGADISWRVHDPASEIAFQADIIDRGRYDGAETYREGHIVDLADGSRWLYVNPVPSSGNTPQTGSLHWSRLSGPVDAQTVGGAAAAAIVDGAGRARDGLAVGGAVNVPLPDAIKVASDLVVRAGGGGSYTGALNATRNTGAANADGLEAIDAGGPLFIGQLPIDKAVTGLRNNAITVDIGGILSGIGTAEIVVNNQLLLPPILDAATRADFDRVTNVPVEITDGRIAAGLAPNGDQNRPLPATIAAVSDLVRGGGGGNLSTLMLDRISGGFVGEGTLARQNSINPYTQLNNSEIFSSLTWYTTGSTIPNGIRPFGQSLRKVSGTGWNATAITREKFTHGFVLRFSAIRGTPNNRYMLGLTDIDSITASGSEWQQLDFAWYSHITSLLSYRIYESGVDRGQFLNDSQLSPNDTFEIEYRDGDIVYNWLPAATGIKTEIRRVTVGPDKAYRIAFTAFDPGAEAGSISVSPLAHTKAAFLADANDVFGSPQVGGLIPNGNFQQVNSAGLPLGFENVEGGFSVSYKDAQRSAVVISGSGNNAMGFPAIPLDPKTRYILRVRHRSSGATTSGLFIRFNALTTDTLPSGKTHIGSGNTTIRQARQTLLNLVDNGPMPGTVERTDDYIFNPTNGMTLGSLSFYNWNSGVDYEIISVNLIPVADETRLDALQLINGPQQASADVTSSNTAAFLQGSGSGAYANNLGQLNSAEGSKLDGVDIGATRGARAGSNIFRTDGSTVLQQNEIRTEEGTAAFLQGEGPGARAPAEQIFNHKNENGVLVISQPSGAAYSGTNIENGAIRIDLPQLWTNTMMRFNVEIYNYITATSQTYMVGGYNNTGNRWINPFAQMIGQASDAQTVRFGSKSGKAAIWIGDPNSSWVWVSIRVINFTARFSNFSYSQWGEGWNISLDTSPAVNEHGTNPPLVITNPRASDAVFGINTFEGVGGAPATLGNFKTNVGTAALLAGSGSGAYANNLAQLDSGANTKLGGIEANADVTLNAVRVIVPQFPIIEIRENEAGSIGNRLVTHFARRGNTTITGGTWSLTGELLGNGNANINSTNGSVTLSGIHQSGSYSIRYIHTDGVPTFLTVNLLFVAAPSMMDNLTISNDPPIVDWFQGTTTSIVVTHIARSGSTTLSGGTWVRVGAAQGGSVSVNASNGNATVTNVTADGRYTIRYTPTDGSPIEKTVNIRFYPSSGGGGGVLGPTDPSNPVP